MKKLLFYRNTFYRRIFATLVGLLIISQVITLFSIFLLLLFPGAYNLTELALALFSALDLMTRQDNPQLLQSFLSIIHEFSTIQWTINSEIAGRFEAVDSISHPGLIQTAKTVEALSGGKLILFTEHKSNGMVWLYQLAKPHFALGMQFKSLLWIPQYAKIVFTLILLLSLISGWWLASRLSNPLHRLAQDAIKMGIDKSTQLSVAPKDPVEFTQLAGALNTMRADMESLVRKREECLAAISHDLRTPLTRMRVNIDLLPESTLVSDMRDDIDEMSVGLEQTVELARLDIEASEPWMKGEADAFIQKLTDKYQRIGANLDFIPGNVGLIDYKPIALTRLLYNLIDNSLKHGEGRVIIRTLLTEESAEVQISTVASNDTNPSNPYTTLWTSSGGQSGLGGKIINRLAEVHGARLEVHTHQTGQMNFRLIFNRRHLISSLSPSYPTFL